MKNNSITIINKDNVIVDMTPSQIYDRVIADSIDPKYNFTIPVTELFRVTSMKGFPRHYAKEIQTAILYHPSLEDGEELKVADTIYNRTLLNEEEDEVIAIARNRYLISLIEKATELAYDYPIYPVLEYDKLKSEWINEKISQYENIYGINSFHLLEVLIKDYRKFIESSKKVGILYTEEKMDDLEENNRKILMKMLINL